MRFSRLCCACITVVLLQAFFAFQLLAAEKDERLVITAEEIRTMNVLKIGDLLNRIPGVKAGETSVSIRGSSNVQVILDGRSINDPTSFAGSVKWSMIPLDTIEKIVVLKGGGSTAYGDNTGGGVIVITTKSANHLGGTAGGYLGNNGQKKAALNLQGRKGRLSASLSSGYEEYEGFTINDDKTRRRFGARVDYRFSDNVSLFLSGDYNDEKKGMRGYPESRTPNSRKDYDDISLVFGQKIKEVSGRSWYSESQTKSRDPDKDIYASLEVVKAGQSVHAPLMLPFLGKIDAGTGYEWQEASGNRFKTADEERMWVFVSKTLKRDSSPWSLMIGGRANYYSAFSNAFNPEVKAAYRRKGFSVEASASLSSNLPTCRQRYYESSSTRPNPDLQMERAANYALAVSVAADSSWSVDASVFFRDITDRITYVRNLKDNTGRYENFGEVTYQGFEVSATWAPFSLIEISPSYTYMQALNEETGYWLPARPFHTVMTDFVFRPLEDLSLRASVKYNGSAYVDTKNTRTLPAYAVVEARADYRLGALTVYCDVDNLLDENYLYVDGYDAPPREWVVGMNYNF